MNRFIIHCGQVNLNVLQSKTNSFSQMRVLTTLLCFFITISLLHYVNSFEFRAVQVTPDKNFVNQQTFYTFFADRTTVNPNLFPTAWQTQSVPSGSTIVIIFPVQYTLGVLACDSVTINTLTQTIYANGYTWTVNGQQLIIEGLFGTSQIVQNVEVKVSNIVNPSVAMTTDKFVMKIGSDISQETYSSDLQVTLVPTPLTQVSATFDPKTVNTTGSLILSLTSQNIIKANSNLVIQFPNLLQWSKDISTSHQIPISSTLSCSGVTSNTKVSIPCSGSLSSRQITLFNINDLVISANSIITVKIGQLFSPPSTQEIDLLKVKTKAVYNGNYYDVDSDSVVIKGLTPKTLNVVSTPTSKMVVNSKVGTQFDITLADTINQNDVIKIYFPALVSFTVSGSSTSTTGFNLNSTLIYDSLNKILTINQRTSIASVNFANKLISITTNFITAPPSIKPFSLKVQIWRGTGIMAQGTATMNAVVNNYVGSVTGNEMGVNKPSKYDIVLDLKDPHSSAMLIEIIVPNTLVINSATFSCKTSLSIVSPNFVISGNMITLSNLVTTTSTIPAQQITITLNNLVNPSSVKLIGSFSVRTYYSSDLQQKVSQGTIANSLITTSGIILQSSAKILPTSQTTYEFTTYNILFTIQNPIQPNGYLTITLPSQLQLSQFTSVKLTTSAVIAQAVPFVITLPSTVKVINNLTTTISQQEVKLTFGQVRNPTSTKPTQTKQFNVHSYNSVGQSIDVLDVNNAITAQATLANDLLSIELKRNGKNDEPQIWSISLQQSQKYESGQKVILAIDPSSTVSSSLTCTDTLTSLSTPCSLLPSKPTSILTSSFPTLTPTFSFISLTIPSTYTGTTTKLSFMIASIKNPSSFASLPILFLTLSSDLLYLYSAKEQTYQNSQLSVIGIDSYSFSVRQLKESTVLGFKYTVPSVFGYMMVQLENTLFDIAGITCSSIQWSDLICTIVDSNTIRLTSPSSPPKTATVTISQLYTPQAVNLSPLYIKIYSFSTSDSPMGSNTNTIAYSLQCAYPCKTCSPTNSSSCLTCYKSPLSTKQFLGSDSLCYQQCPDGFINNVDTYTCQKCVQPCLFCNGVKNNCTKCNSTSEFIYLSYTQATDLTTCLKTCPSKSFPDTNSIPVYCQLCKQPCYECTSSTTCVSCVTTSTYYLYKSKCQSSCPADVTVPNTTALTCIPCSSQCKTCSNVVTNCTSCSTLSIFYEGKCLLSCPTGMIKYNQTCVACDSACLQCSMIPTNCTSCKRNSTFAYYFSQTCLQKCPNFHYPDPNNICLQCVKLTTNCKNCSSETVCQSCDAGFVLFEQKCLSTVPQGYINISGVAVPCSGDCKTCLGTVTNCTSCKTLNLNGNICQSQCNTGQTPIQQVCSRCQYPCQSCSGQVNFCLTCYANSSLFLYGSSCLTGCPDKFYGNTTSLKCQNCVSPCQKCTDDATCLTCLTGYNYLSSTKQCLSTCPDGMVGQNRICVACQSPCLACQTVKTKCSSCIQNYFLNQNQCLTQCPTSSIKNETSRTCQSCQSPCLTCNITTTTCLTCQQGYIFFQSQCLSQCPDTYFSSAGKCVVCTSPCLTCTSASVCSSCTGTLLLYKNTCIQTCPLTQGKIINGVCTKCDTGCYSCTTLGICTQCYPSYIFFEDQCISACPTNYIQTKINGTSTCVIKQQSDIQLETSLTNQSSLFPLPFTIFGLIVLGAGLISKLQNKNTFLIGLAYCTFGILESLVVLYVLYEYYFKYGYDLLIVYLLLIGLGIIVVLNVLGFFVHTGQLVYDKRFEAWRKRQECSNNCVFWISTTISLLINYKFKLIMFSKIFNFDVFKAQMTSVEKFKVFNVFSFLGIIAEAELLYTTVRQVLTKNLGGSLKLIFVDAIIILALNVVFSIAASWKGDDFFTEEIDGIVINKKVTIDGDFINKKALQDDEEYTPYNQTRKTGQQSHQGLKNYSNIIKEEVQEYSVSITEEKNSEKSSKSAKTKDKLFFEDEDLSSQTLRYKDELDTKPKFFNRQNFKQSKVTIFQNQIQQQVNQNRNQEEVENFGDYDISSDNSDKMRKSAKKSENIFCQSPRKKSKKENHTETEKGHYTEEQEDVKVKKIKLNKEIEESASQFNKIRKDKQIQDIIRDDSTKMKRSQKAKSKKSDLSKEKTNKQSQNNKTKIEKNNDKKSDISSIQKKSSSKVQKSSKNVKKQKQWVPTNTNQSSKKILVPQDENQPKDEKEPHPLEKQSSTKKITYVFEQVSSNLESNNENFFEENNSEFIKDEKSNKMKINSMNSSKTAFATKNTPKGKDQGLIDSESQTVYNQSKLRPQAKQSSIKQLQSNSKMKSLSYEGQQNEIAESPLQGKKRKQKITQTTPNIQKYDKIRPNESVIESNATSTIPIQIQHMELTQSEEQQSKVDEIQRNPLGYSPESRVIDNQSSDLKDFSNDSMIMELSSHVKSHRQNVLISDERLNNGELMQIDQRKQTMNTISDHQTLDNQQKRNRSNNNSPQKLTSDQYSSLIKTINSSLQNKKSKKKLIQSCEPVNKQSSNKLNDIYLSIDIEEGESPIKRRQSSSREKNYPIEEKSQRNMNKEIESLDKESDMEEYKNGTFKRAKKMKTEANLKNVNVPDIVHMRQPQSPINPKLRQNTTSPYNIPKVPKDLHSKSKPLIRSNHIQFDPSCERIDTQALKTQEMKDQLDNFSMQKIKMTGQNNLTNYAYHSLQKPQVDRRFNTFISNETLPRPNVTHFESMEKRKNRKFESQKRSESLEYSNSFITGNDQSLAHYYRSPKKLKQTERSNQKAGSRSKSRQGHRQRFASTQSPSREGKWHNNSSQTPKNQISNKRFKQLQKIYLQKLH